jgi:SAM-dependent methyltransferase
MIHQMKLPRTRVLPVYSGYFAVLYDALSQDYTWDLPLLSELVVGGPKQVLELGCGSGRITLPLARAGHRVVGVDRCDDMLAAAARPLWGGPAPCEGRATPTLTALSGPPARR